MPLKGMWRLFGTNNLGAENGFVQVKLTVQFLDRCRLTVHIYNCVDAFAFFIDLECHTATAPHIELVDAASAIFDDLEICLK